MATLTRSVYELTLAHVFIPYGGVHRKISIIIFKSDPSSCDNMLWYVVVRLIGERVAGCSSHLLPPLFSLGASSVHRAQRKPAAYLDVLSQARGLVSSCLTLRGNHLIVQSSMVIERLQLDEDGRCVHVGFRRTDRANAYIC